MSQHLGINDPAIPRVATAFGGGVGGTGSMCGAVIGGVMAIGLKYGRDASSERDAHAYAATQTLCRGFKDAMGALDCRTLTGLDLTTREGAKALYGGDIPRRVCQPAVGTAYRLTLELLKESRPSADA